MLKCQQASRPALPFRGREEDVRDSQDGRKAFRQFGLVSQPFLGRDHLSHPPSPAKPLKKAVLMADSPIVMREPQYSQIKAVLAKLRLDAAARVTVLIDKDGQEIAVDGDVSNLDTTSLASLTAGNVAATGGMARLIGEKEFPTLSHEGERESIHICVIGRALLVVVFDDRSSLGLVKLRVKQVSGELAAIFEAVVREARKSSDEPSIFAEITDEDIDSLFN